MVQTLIWDDNISIVNVKAFELAIQNLLESNASGIILNLDRVSYMNSRGLGVIADAVKEAARLEKQIVISHIQKSMKEIFDIVRFDSIIRIFPTDNEAQKFLEKSKRVSLTA
ncbi:STAS domain-containing protein [Bacillus sp. Marseille-P3661]|uniref:STAS domain-containing protein n=1 Tax=Bacillus sp. Marseille-P3661 TaxID=1936234 RepID=UPI000C85EB3A|nr:STAS domain-containing protein [Bacillus sp. Marseille-P3661]